MLSVGELARSNTTLDDDAIDHLYRLMASWGLLADLCFADLLLFAPGKEGSFVVLGQMRPTTSQTVYRDDWVARVLSDVERPLVARSFRLGEIIEGEINMVELRERVRVTCIPVRHKSELIGVLTRESAPSIGRQPGELERTYVEVFNRFARMIAAGDFPYPTVHSDTDEVPRVGDGVMILDRAQRVEYSSPNAVSALHRIGIHGNRVGLRIDELGLNGDAVRTAFTHRMPTTDELERLPDTTVVMWCLPLLDRGEPSGAVVLLRDISELRRRDRLLLSKDATIREMHHRVKNNLQTISSLLRIQGRRLSSDEAKAAVEESVQRIGAIALVHETLSTEVGDDVLFAEIVRPLVRMVEEGLVGPSRPIRFVVRGDGGRLAADVATPLAVVLTELLQNAVGHAFPDEDQPGEVVVELFNDGVVLGVRVTDDGIGLPDGFSIDDGGLGLSIVRTLVANELLGTIQVSSGEEDGRGTEVVVTVPVAPETLVSQAADETPASA